MPDHERPRLPPTTAADWDDETAAIMEATGGLNIFATLAHHPKLLKRWLVFGGHVLAKSTLPARERELAILRTGWRCGSAYEFGQHTSIGEAAGLHPDEIVRVTGDRDDPAWSDDDRWLLRAVDELVDDKVVSDDTWAALAERWSTQQLMDLVFAVGQYTLVSMALRTFGVPLDDGVPGFPDDRP
ncbi:MAG: carboxymuconolactone decarboxylase family protein [Acidimicrobiia bacterium]|nr:carboxymuconolactone decarboxylase family protein [Acidimicrobiia bacterium]